MWLTFLYVTCMTLVILSLTIYQLQHRIYSTLRSPPSPALLKFHECDPKPYTAEGTDSGAQQEVGALIKFKCIPLSITTTPSYFSPGTLFQHYEDIKERKETLTNEKDKLKLLQSNSQSTKEEIDKQIEIVIIYDENVRAAITQNSHLEAVYNDTRTYDAISNSIFRLKGLWAIPENILIVILIFSMGALGSLIFLTMEFLKRSDNTEEKFSNYFFRPLLGMVMALAVFVMFRSGQYSMGIESEEHLSPFFISFMSIISGMMSEKVYGSLKLQGEKVLPTEENEK